MATLDDIIRDAMNSIRPKKKTRPLKMRTPNFGDVANDPLSSIKRPRRRQQGSAAASKGSKRIKAKPNVSEKAANKGTLVKVPRPKGDYRAYARYKRVYGSGKTGGMR